MFVKVSFCGLWWASLAVLYSVQKREYDRKRRFSTLAWIYCGMVAVGSVLMYVLYGASEEVQRVGIAGLAGVGVFLVGVLLWYGLGEPRGIPSTFQAIGELSFGLAIVATVASVIVGLEFPAWALAVSGAQVVGVAVPCALVLLIYED